MWRVINLTVNTKFVKKKQTKWNFNIQTRNGDGGFPEVLSLFSSPYVALNLQQTLVDYSHFSQTEFRQLEYVAVNSLRVSVSK